MKEIFELVRSHHMTMSFRYEAATDAIIVRLSKNHNGMISHIEQMFNLPNLQMMKSDDTLGYTHYVIQTINKLVDQLEQHVWDYSRFDG